MGLSETQEAEVRKAFAMCDRDGNGSIDLNELRTGTCRRRRRASLLPRPTLTLW